MPDDSAKCVFCGKSRGDTHASTGRSISDLIVNHEQSALICSECVHQCVGILDRREPAGAESGMPG